MQLRYLHIERFRGIRLLDWKISGQMVCLVGPGDSTKSTILDAIEQVLSPRWNVSFSDTDFYQCDISQPFEITAAVGQLPKKLFDISKFGLDLQGWHADKGLLKEPDDDCEPVLVVRLSVDKALEPNWCVLSDKSPEGRTITAADREALGIARLGSYVDRQLSWGRGSALTRFTGEMESIALTLAEASRSAQGIIATANLPQLAETAERAAKIGQQFGVKPAASYRPALDAQLSLDGTSVLTLHDGKVPLRQSGLGTKRLLTLSIQRSSVTNGAVLLIDEIEQGLEPHRLRHLLRHLRPSEGKESTAEQAVGQNILTTHSPIAVAELRANELSVVRCVDGQTTVKSISSDLQALVRRAPEALLACKVLVCEGKTELGICRALDEKWSSKESLLPFGTLGLVPVDGGGTQQAARTALDLANLGYETALLVDSDATLVPGSTELAAGGVYVIQWPDGTCTEQRLCLDFLWPALRKFVAIAAALTNAESVYDAVIAHLSLDKPSPYDLDAWRDGGKTEDEIRRAIGFCAKKRAGSSRSGWVRNSGI